MKWTNKTHEYDNTYEYLKPMLQKAKNGCWLFGAGQIGVLFASLVKEISVFKLMGFIDNNIQKQGTSVEGLSCISFKEYVEKYRNQPIIIAVSSNSATQIKKQLNESNLVKGVDYYDDYDKLMALVLLYEKNKLYIPVTQICVTERCTLKCIKCAHACNLVENGTKDLEIGYVKKTADDFFRLVDYCRDFELIGGEPFLYQELDEAIEYIAGLYRDRINKFYITTNGSILPKDITLEKCKKYNVTVNISNYSRSVKWLGEKYKLLTEKLKEKNTSYVLGKEENEWTDYGFGEVNRKADPVILEGVFDKCKTICHESRGSRFYYCVMARAVSENMKLNIGDEDYLDLTALDGDEGKKIFMEYSLGYSDKGYLDMCNYCRGNERNQFVIPAAKQTPTELDRKN